MDKRLRKTQRLLKVQEQMHRIAEWKLAGLQRQASELRDAQETLIQTLNDDDALHGLFVAPAARRLQQLAGQSSQVEAAQTAQSQIVLDKAMQVKRTERMVGTLEQEHRRNTEKKDYLSLLDRLATKRDASLP
ncbi:hypothetical protein [Microvirga flavescens]|uniref:hypothetical protein n=1 Tax=Microvirga flavescens TaxID=2249811 RepID=UPI001300BE28|nr:hypothetical protein [Microvirga flavescens]